MPTAHQAHGITHHANSTPGTRNHPRHANSSTPGTRNHPRHANSSTPGTRNHTPRQQHTPGTRNQARHANSTPGTRNQARHANSTHQAHGITPTPGHICTDPERTQRTRVGVARRGVFVATGAFLSAFDSEISIFYGLYGAYKKSNRNPSDCFKCAVICLFFLFIQFFHFLESNPQLLLYVRNFFFLRQAFRCFPGVLYNYLADLTAYIEMCSLQSFLPLYSF